MEQNLSQKLRVAQLIKKFRTFYWNQRLWQEAATRYPETVNTSLRPKVKGEERQSQLSFMLHNYTTLMCDMFRHQFKKSSSGEITLQINHVNYINSSCVSLRHI